MKFDLDEQQRDFAASIDAALGAADRAGRGAGVGRRRHRAGPQGVGTAGRPRRDRAGGSARSSTASERTRSTWWWRSSDSAAGACPARSPNPLRWHRFCSPTTTRSAALAAGELIATVAMPPQMPRAVDAGFAGPDPGRRRRCRSRRRPRASATSRSTRAESCSTSAPPVTRGPPTSHRAYEFGALATAAQLIGAGQAMLDASVEYAKQRTQFGRVIGSYQAIKHKLADVHIALELARPLVYGAALSLAPTRPDTARDVSAAKVAASDAGAAGGALGAADPRRDRFHPGTRSVAVAAAGAGAALGLGRSDVHRRRVLEALRPVTRRTGTAARDRRAHLVDKHAVARGGARRDGLRARLRRVAVEAAVRTGRRRRAGGARGTRRRRRRTRRRRRRASRSSAAALVPTPLLGTTLAELALLAADEPDAETVGALAEGTVDRRRRVRSGLRAQRRRRRRRGRAPTGHELTRWTSSRRTDRARWTRPAGSRASTPGDTAADRDRPRARRHRGDPAGRRADRRRRRGAWT